MDDLRPAATVILVRDAPGGVETLMLRRSGRAGFLPDAWVFPGGIVDERDAGVRSSGEVPGLGEPAFAVAAVRECFEEAGIWLGEGAPAPGVREALQAGKIGLSDLPDLRADLGRLRLWSRWITPVVEKRRYDTLFFVAAVGGDEVAWADRVETVTSEWVRPADGLARQSVESFFMAPPTFRTLEDLCVFECAEDVLAAAAERAIVPILPVRERYPGALVSVVLPGHEAYPTVGDAAPGLRRIALVEGRWRSLP